MQTLPDALCARLGYIVYVNTPVQGLEQTADGWGVTAQHQQQYVTQRFDAVLYTAPLYHLPAMGLQGTSEVRTLARVYYSPLSILVLGFRRSQVRHPLDGFGLLVPAVEPLKIFGTLFSSTMFPGRAPDGHVTLTIFMGGARNPAACIASACSVALQTAQSSVWSAHRHIAHFRAVPQCELSAAACRYHDTVERQYLAFSWPATIAGIAIDGPHLRLCSSRAYRRQTNLYNQAA
jgi:hypothetical protein